MWAIYMKAFFTKYLHRAWYGGEVTLWYFFPLTFIYVALFYLRKRAFDFGLFATESSNTPVVVVGNITVGGTGKTPLVIALANYLKEKGYKPGIVSRGYGADASIFPQLINENSTASNVGDEPLLIYEQTGAPVVVDPLRPRGVRLLVADGACDIVISDDGLQHYAMDRDIEVVVLDAERMIGNGLRLPMGPLREPASRLSSVDLLVLNGKSQSPPEEKLGQFGPSFEMSLNPSAFEALPHTSEMSVPKLENKIHAVAAIGNPQRFFATLKKLGFNIIPHEFEDHHYFKPKDLDFGDELPIVMTAKDAVKCRDFINEKLWYLPVEASLPSSFFEAFDEILLG